MTSVFLPREHGAYGQLIFPLVTALLVAGVSAGGLLIGASAVAAFFAHEPLLVVLGRRGVRARVESGRGAMTWLVTWSAVAVLAAGTACITLSPAGRWACAVPAVAAAALFVTTTLDREKSWYGELAAALGFSSIAVPVGVAGGTDARTALAVAVPFALLFTCGTLAVRVVILRTRAGGDAVAARRTQHAAWLVAASGTVGVGAVAALGVAPAAIAFASAPGLLLAAGVAAAPPPARRLRIVGWSLVAASVATMTAIVIWL